jgi:type I restriction enzyme S subunit
MSKFIPAQQYCVKVFDGTHDTPKPFEIGYPLVTSKNILGRKLNLKDTYNISKEDYFAVQKRSAVSKWDILFSMIGSIGEIYLEKNDNIPYAIKNVGVFSTNDEYKAKWLYYYLISPYAKAFIKNYLAGAVQKFLALGTLREFPIIPYDDSRKKIVDLLYAIDSKIELNNKINTELEAMAKTLYDYWFVQFDFPDENGKPYKSSGGEMVWSEELKREIPKGWEVESLLDIADFVNGLACQKYRPKASEDFYRVVKIREMSDGFTDSSEFVSRKIPEKVIIDD